MSVRTSADEKRDEAKDHIADALKCLTEIVNDEIWGYDDYNEEYKDKLDESISLLRKIKRML